MSSTRVPLIDSLKAVGSQLIVLHHLAFYGPLSDAAHRLLPSMIDWFYDNARIAVQAFLVVGGFLAARSLAPRGESQVARPQVLLWRRYRRLAVPYMLALLVCVAMSALVRPWLNDDAVPAPPKLAQLGAHMLLLQDVLGQEALSAGAWYVAIDFQLFALFVCMLWLARKSAIWLRMQRDPGMWLVGALALASLFYFNRDEAWDVWAVYFFGAYGLGAFAWWAAELRRPTAALGLIAMCTGIALVVDFRERILVALSVALFLGVARRTGKLLEWEAPRPVLRLGRMSYSLFLVHFSVCLLVNALWMHWLPMTPLMGLIGMGVAWAASMLAGACMYRLVESRLA